MLLLGIAVGVVVWVLAGYPLLLAWLVRRRSVPTVKRFEPRTVSILLPVRNGEPWIRAKLESILALHYPRNLIQTIVVSDGSEDQTERIALEYAKHGVEVVPMQHSGKAVALNEALRRATGEILFFTDARQPLDAECLRQLVACFGDPRVGAASGELIVRDGHTREEAATGLYWKYEKWMRKRLSLLDSVPGATGACYAMRAELANPLPPGTILDDAALPLGPFFRGFRVILDESARAYDYPTSLRTEFRRKVRTQAGVYQLVALFPALLLPGRNRMWFHFVSHKLGRLALPWALLAIFPLSFGLPPVWRELWLGGQVLFYGLAGLDPLLAERSQLKRLSAPIRTFVVLMAAAALAAAALFVSQKTLWRETRVAVGKAQGAA